MSTPYLTSQPTSGQLAASNTRPTVLGPEHGQPVHPARVNPADLPALAHVAADLDGLTVPVRVVPAAELGVCVECSSGPLGDGPVLDAIATVRTPSGYGFRYADEVCALHLRSTVADWQRLDRDVTVEVPATGGRRWFERSDRETYYALDDRCGIAVVRGRHDVWMVVEADSGYTYETLAIVGLQSGEGYEQARERAEALAQAVAAQRATETVDLAALAAA